MYDLKTLHADIFTAEYFSTTESCRLCLCKNANIDLLSKTSILEDISFCLDIMIFPEAKPNKICIRCYGNLVKFTTFKKYCQKANEILENISFESISNPLNEVILTPKEEKPENSTDNLEIQSSDHHFLTEEAGDSISDNETLIKKIVHNKYSKQQRLYCRLCSSKFPTAKELNKHNLTVHQFANGTFKCFGCFKEFSIRGNRLRHERDFCEHLLAGFFCQSCKIHLPTREEFEKHTLNHVDDKTVKIPHPDRRARSLLAKSAQNTSTTALIPKNGSNRSLPAGNPSDTSKSHLEISCRKCNESFDSIDGWRSHSKIHTKKACVCESCGRVFARRDYLRKHMSIHTGARQHPCPYCSFSSSQRSGLTVHIRKHTGNRPFSCDLCPQKCISSSNLLAHRKRHLGVKEFQCKICSKQFGYKASLDEHVACVHNQPPSLICSICNANYPRLKALRRHMRTKHPGVDFKPTKDKKNGIQNGDAVEQNGVAVVQNGVAINEGGKSEELSKLTSNAFGT